MLKDIDVPKVDQVAVAITREVNLLNEEEYNAWLINFKGDALENVLIRSSGYGVHEGNKYETTELRRFYDRIEPNAAIKIEPVLAEALHLSNQYWVSFYDGKVLYDRKYVFVPGSIDPSNYITVPFVDLEGVMIK
ncbi:MAG: hypothetical protein ACFCUH_05495 [Flavobacteriales bacterium]|jgi:hypothetical protein